MSRHWKQRKAKKRYEKPFFKKKGKKEGKGGKLPTYKQAFLHSSPITRNIWPSKSTIKKRPTKLITKIPTWY